MKFCIIAPISGLERYASLSPIHLILPHIVDERYYEYYAQRRKMGEKVILDNGAYEHEAQVFERMEKCMLFVRPQVVSLPDYLLQPWDKTWHASIHFLNTVAEKWVGVEWLYIPQSTQGDLIGFQRGLLKGLEDSRITWVGLPRALETHIAGTGSRVTMAKLARMARSDIKIHALGMSRGNVDELKALTDVGVDAIDSSAPVWRGWHLKSLRQTSGLDAVPDCNFVDTDVPNAGGLRDNMILDNLEVVGVDTSKLRGSR